MSTRHTFPLEGKLSQIENGGEKKCISRRGNPLEVRKRSESFFSPRSNTSPFNIPRIASNLLGDRSFNTDAVLQLRNPIVLFLHHDPRPRISRVLAFLW